MKNSFLKQFLLTVATIPIGVNLPIQASEPVSPSLHRAQGQPHEATSREAQPNIVVILADDLGYGSVGAYGAPDSLVQTPKVDRLAKEGKRFTDAYTGSSVCSPTRYGLLTGRYAFRTNLQRGVLNPFSPLHIASDQLTVASLLKSKGYTTAAVGKWHLGYGNARSSDGRTDYKAKLAPGPLEIGFDYHFGVPSNHGDLTGVYVENHYVYGLRSGRIEEGAVIGSPEPGDSRFSEKYSRVDGVFAIRKGDWK